MRRRTLWMAAILTAVFLLVPSGISAGITDQTGRSSRMVGTNHVTWDSNFVQHGYVPGEPVTLKIDWSGTERVSGLVSIGLKERGFSPAGTHGRIAGIQRTGPTSALVTMAVSELASPGVGNVKLKMNLAVDDGSGRFLLESFDINCHVVSARSKSGRGRR